MTSVKTIVDNTITILKAADSLKNVRKWHLGQPPEGRVIGYPYGWVEWLGGIVATDTPVIEDVKDTLLIVIVDMNAAEDKAEDSVMDYAEKIKNVIYADRTLNDAVKKTFLRRRDKQKLLHEDYSVAAVGLTFELKHIDTLS